MSKKIVLRPEEVWGFYIESTKNNECLDMFEIASNSELGTTIYLSDNSFGVGLISVEADGQVVYKEEIVSMEDAKKTAQRIYDDYLTDKAVDILSDIEIDSDDCAYEREDEILTREDELSNLVWEFLMGVFGYDTYFDCDEDVIDDIKDHFLEYMFRKHGFDVYRPMYLEDDDGNEFYEEYPYDYMEFDDEDNPLYTN